MDKSDEISALLGEKNGCALGNMSEPEAERKLCELMQKIELLERQNQQLVQQDQVKQQLIHSLREQLQEANRLRASAKADDQATLSAKLTTSELITSTQRQNVDVYEDNICYEVAQKISESQNQFMAKRLSLKNQDNEILYTIQQCKDAWDKNLYKEVK